MPFRFSHFSKHRNEKKTVIQSDLVSTALWEPYHSKLFDFQKTIILWMLLQTAPMCRIRRISKYEQFNLFPLIVDWTNKSNGTKMFNAFPFQFVQKKWLKKDGISIRILWNDGIFQFNCLRDLSLQESSSRTGFDVSH